MATKGIIFFEEINLDVYPLVENYLKDGFKVYFFKIHPSCIAKSKNYFEQGILVDISSWFNYAPIINIAAFYAHQRVDSVFNKHFASSHSIRNMSKLLDFSEIVNMYKYNLLLELTKRFEIELKINDIVKNEESNENYFIPVDYIYLHSSEDSLLGKNIHIIRKYSLRKRIADLLTRLKQTIMLLAPFYLLFKKMGKIVWKAKRKKYSVAIMDDHPENIFKMNYFGNNVFIDEKELRASDVLFITNWQKDATKLIREKGFNAVSIYDTGESLTGSFIFSKFLLQFMPAWFKTMLFALFEKPEIVNTNKSILLNYVVWNIFLDNYEINNYVKRLLPDNIAKISILRHYGIRTWFIFPDNTAFDYHLDWNQNKQVQTLYSFMYFDKAVIHGDMIERQFKKHKNFIKEYIKTGVLFSQTAREIEEGKLKTPLFDLIKTKKMPNKLIGVFDTSVSNFGPVKIEDGVSFANNILRLLEDFPDLGMVFKAAKEYELTNKAILPIYEKLKSHPRCLFFYRYSAEGISAPEVIAVSDLTISAAYISTTAEALGARKRAFYYDSGGRNIGNGFYYNNFPNFVAHNYNELKKLTNYWLYKQSDKEFDNFLNKYVKNEMDPYLDAKGFSRLRKLLTNS